MEDDQKQTSFTFEIDNLSEKGTVIESPKILSGGFEWYVNVYPKGDCIELEDHLSMYLCVANTKSLRLGWKKRAIFSFILLNQSGKELYRSPESCKLFCAQLSGWGILKPLPLKNLQEEGFLEKNKLIIKVEVKVVEVVDEGDVTGNETFDVRGFQVPYSQVASVSSLFWKHPDIARNFRPKNQLVKITYMNLLLGLIKTLEKPPHRFSEAELNNAQDDLNELTEAGFKLDWLKTKFDEVSLEWKKANANNDPRVRELEERIKNLEFELNTEKFKSAAKLLSLEQTVSYLRANHIQNSAGRGIPYSL